MAVHEHQRFSVCGGGRGAISDNASEAGAIFFQLQL